MLLDERIDALTAMGTSMALVWNNLPVMLAWGAIVLALFLVSLATGLLGLIVVFPLLGHGTWHAYRAMRPECDRRQQERADELLRLGAELRCCRCASRPATKFCWPAATSATACGRPTSPSRHPLRRLHRRRSRARSARLPGVEQARVNLSTKRVTVRWRSDERRRRSIETLERARLRGASLRRRRRRARTARCRELVRALAVAGFAASNIMLLSVSVWSGAEPQTRDLFHWISAVDRACPRWPIPAASSSARPGTALRHGRTNMDVPISIGVLLAFGMSLYETIHHGPHAYFDAAISLLFFLLIGRTLDHVMRERARHGREGPGAARRARRDRCCRPDGTQHYLPVERDQSRA